MDMVFLHHLLHTVVNCNLQKYITIVMYTEADKKFRIIVSCNLYNFITEVWFLSTFSRNGLTLEMMIQPLSLLLGIR